MNKFLVVNCCLCLRRLVRDVHLAAGGGVAQVGTVVSSTADGAVPGNPLRHMLFNPFEQTEN